MPFAFPCSLVSFGNAIAGKNLIFPNGCNTGFWRKDLIAVNGYNESISGSGREDAEIEVHLMKLGIRRQSLKFAGAQYHLFHKGNDRSRDAKNIEILNRALASPEFWTPHGIVKNEIPKTCSPHERSCLRPPN